jgi:ribosome recycling factor
MDLNVGLVQTAEIQDALGACDELHAVLARLKRHGLLTEDEDRETMESIQTITDTLLQKLPEGAE